MLANALFQLMEEKQSNLALAADVTTAEELLHLAKTLGPTLCILKTHIDIIKNFTPHLTRELKAIARIHRFLLFEDRKFADIGNTVKWQYGEGIYRIADWADLINAHIIPGPGIIEGLREVGLPQGRGLLLLAQMSSEGSLATGAYTEAAIALAQSYPDFVMGFIARKRLIDDPRFVHMTPGVQLKEGKDALGQRYLTPYHVIAECKSDVIIVGRGIYQAKDPLCEAQAYQEAGWAAHQEKVTIARH